MGAARHSKKSLRINSRRDTDNTRLASSKQLPTSSSRNSDFDRVARNCQAQTCDWYYYFNNRARRSQKPEKREGRGGRVTAIFSVYQRCIESGQTRINTLTTCFTLNCVQQKKKKKKKKKKSTCVDTTA